MAEALGLAFIRKEVQLQDNLIGTGFAEAPQSGKTRVNYTGEIVQAVFNTVGFDEPRVNLNYKVWVPEDWEFDDFNKYDTLGIEGDQDLINKRESITQFSMAKVIEYQMQKVYQSNFSFPFDLQFIHTHNEESSARPHLLFQVNSCDSWNRHRIEGYGALQFPQQEGYHEFKIQTWKPRGSFNNEIHSFFLGGSVRVIELEDIIQSFTTNEKGERDFINRFDFETEDSGEIIVRVNCMSHNYDRKKKNRAEHDIEREKQQQEIVKCINAERVKNIKKYRKKIKEILDEEIVSEPYQSRYDEEESKFRETVTDSRYSHA